ncbi:MAG: sensor domain-containing diguanylate cyclase [Clostridia bacterium]|nr:sensor domain-containing diguanylate cyclase [Clostridia bacterium]
MEKENEDKKTNSIYVRLVITIVLAIFSVTMIISGMSIYAIGKCMNMVFAEGYNEIKYVIYSIEAVGYALVFLVAILFSVVTVMIAGRIVKPLNQLMKEEYELSNGDYEVDIKPSNIYEIDALGTAFVKMAESIKEHDHHQHMLAYRDSLTGLRNVTSYKSWTSRIEEEIKNSDTKFGIVVCDLNELKETNDNIGHEAGNSLICSAAQIISGVFKRSPVFRIGGDEFAVILKNRDYDEGNELINKLDRRCKNEFITAENKTIPVHIARGVAFYNSETDKSVVDVFNRADDLMYENKRNIKTGMK